MKVGRIDSILANVDDMVVLGNFRNEVKLLEAGKSYKKKASSNAPYNSDIVEKM
jgi:hypothetical protein